MHTERDSIIYSIFKRHCGRTALGLNDLEARFVGNFFKSTKKLDSVPFSGTPLPIDLQGPAAMQVNEDLSSFIIIGGGITDR